MYLSAVSPFISIVYNWYKVATRWREYPCVFAKGHWYSFRSSNPTWPPPQRDDEQAHETNNENYVGYIRLFWREQEENRTWGDSCHTSTQNSNIKTSFFFGSIVFCPSLNVLLVQVYDCYEFHLRKLFFYQTGILQGPSRYQSWQTPISCTQGPVTATFYWWTRIYRVPCMTALTTT